MSTDTAFALGVLALAGPRFPDSLRAFLLTVVVVDDLLAIVVIATVYTETLSLVPLAGPSASLPPSSSSQHLLPAGPCLRGARGGAWVALLESGMEPVMLGLAMGLLAYAYPAARSASSARPSASASSASSRPPSSLASAREEVRTAISPNERLQHSAPVDELRDRPAVRARERGHRDRRRTPRGGAQLADHARHPVRLRRRPAAGLRRTTVAAHAATAGVSGRRWAGRRCRRRHGRGHRLHRLAADRSAHIRRARARRGEDRHPRRGARRLAPHLAVVPGDGAPPPPAADRGPARNGRADHRSVRRGRSGARPCA